MTTYVLGGGCFWCLDAVYRRIKGITKVISGYAGGSLENPTYYQVATGTTGHAETVSITFDESVIPAEAILDIFFITHNPTTPNQQGADIGTQYRSIMLYSDNTQHQAFISAKERAQKIWDDPIVTAIEPLTTFYPGEEEHQDYFNKNPEAGYCTVVIEPKITKVRKTYTKWFKGEE